MQLIRRIVLLLMVILVASWASPVITPAQSAPGSTPSATKVYLPLVVGPESQVEPLVPPSPFGFETYPEALFRSDVHLQAKLLEASWIRVHYEVSWRNVQALPDGPYDWTKLARFERTLERVRNSRAMPMVIVSDYPAWATIGTKPCGALREDRLDDFAAFMKALVTRYRQPPFNVHYWELSNEPDVDPDFVPEGHFFTGCWGDKNDPYYGGGRYAAMLKAVTPAMKEADPAAQVIVGGLLLSTAKTENDNVGHQEDFLEGILRGGGAPYFDSVGYHTHTTYNGDQLDYSGPQLGGGFQSRGGLAKGKPRFLQEVMKRYGVEKPLFMNEATLNCNTRHFPTPCLNPPADFYQAQADHVARLMVRTLSVGVTKVSWYTLNGTGWYHSGLLDKKQQPLPSYWAYQTLIKRLRNAELPPASLEFPGGVEAYRFNVDSHLVYVVFVASGPVHTPTPVRVPENKFIAAYSRDGKQLTPSISEGYVEIDVGFSPVYIERKP